MTSVDLSKYTNPHYNHGAGKLKRLIWHITSKCFIHSQFPLPVNLKVKILRFFGAKMGKGIVIKPNVNIKYPWFLEVGDYSWIGEGVWIDNLVMVKIESSCCLSQGAMLLTGNHDFTKPTFDLITGKIIMEQGSWIGAKSIVCPGVTLKSHAVLAVSSVATKDLLSYSIYQGNPAQFTKSRAFK